MINVLVTGTGGGVGQSIVKALKISRLDCKIITTDMCPLAAGIYRGDKGYLVPPATSSNFIDTIIEICKRENIDIVFIGSDPELPVFAVNKRRIEEETGAKVIVSSPEVVKVGYDKWETYKFLKDHNLPYPLSALPEDMYDLVEEVGFPLIVKPRIGSASKDVYVAKNMEELQIFIKRVDNPIIQEYLKPEEEEYTSGVIMFNEKILGIITMKREIKCGTSYRVLIDYYENVKSAVTEVAKLLSPFGPCNFQMRVTEKGPVTFEINPRFSGTTALRAASGFNEPEAVINYLMFDRESTLSYNRGVAMRYWNEVYITFDEYFRLKNEHKIENSRSKIINYF